MDCKGITNEKTKNEDCETNSSRALKYVTNDKPAKKVYAYSITELINNQIKNNKLK